METFNIRKRKNFFETKPEQQRRNKHKINDMLTNILKEFNSFLGLEFGLKLHSVNLVPAGSVNDELFLKTLISNDNLKLDSIISVKTASTQTQESNFNKINDLKNDEIIYRGLKAKDLMSLSKRKFNIMKRILFNDRRYRKLTFCRVNLLKLSMDSIFPIKKNKEGNGYYFDVESKISYFVGKFLDNFNKYDKTSVKKDFLVNNKILIKFAADGANITKTRFKIINLTFTIVNQYNNNSVFAHYLLGMYQIDIENYDSTKSALEEVFVEIGQIDKLTIKNETYTIEKYLSGDMKVVISLLYTFRYLLMIFFTYLIKVFGERIWYSKCKCSTR